MVNVYVWAGMGQFGDGKYEIEKSVGWINLEQKLRAPFQTCWDYRAFSSIQKKKKKKKKKTVK
jgi:hypothetical protein